MSRDDGLDLGLGLEKTHVVVTGAAGHIGLVVVKAFIKAGAYVSAFDIKDGVPQYSHQNLRWDRLDITNESQMESAFAKARARYGLPCVCICLAGLDLSYLQHHASLCDMPLEQWQRTMNVNVNGTFLTARTWMRVIKAHATDETRNISLIVIGSESGVFGQTGNADYSTSKAAIQYGLVRSLTNELPRLHSRARVNAVAPGPVNTAQFEKECTENAMVRWLDSEATVALKTSVSMESVARTCLFLASERYSGHITGQLIQVDSGKQGKVAYLQDGTPV